MRRSLSIALAVALTVMLIGAPSRVLGVAHADAGSDDGGAPFALSATDGPLTVVLSLDPARPAIGAPVRVRIVAALEGTEGLSVEGLAIEWPDVRELVTESLGDLVVEVESMRPTPDGRALEGVLRLFDEGEHVLPAIRIRAVRRAPGRDPERAFEVLLEDATLVVDVDVPDDAEPVGASEPLALTIPEEPFPWWWVGAGAAALVILLGGLVAIARRSRPPPPPPPVVPPHERALDALRELSKRQLPQRGEVEPYFVELSEILRCYLEERFGLRAPEQTTEEFLATVSNTPEGRRAIEVAHRDLLRDFLNRADLVKFARDVPGADECGAAGAGAEIFVRETVPTHAPPEVSREEER